jgi:hypothetical protein
MPSASWRNPPNAELSRRRRYRTVRNRSSQEPRLQLSGREKSNLSRTLKTMESYGFVELKRGVRGRIKPKVVYDRVKLELPLRARVAIMCTQSGGDVRSQRSAAATVHIIAIRALKHSA